MAHAAIAFAKANSRRRMMACTTSVGPGRHQPRDGRRARAREPPAGAAAARATPSRAASPTRCCSRSRTSATRRSPPTIACGPVSRFWDRITRPEQLLASLPQAIAVLLDPADCGPATLALPQDVQAEAFDYPRRFFAERVHDIERPRPDRERLAEAAAAAQGRAPPVHRRRRRRALLRRDRRRSRSSPRATASRSRKRRRARARSPGTTPATPAPSASPARAPRTRCSRNATSCSRSARGCRISRPAPAS